MSFVKFAAALLALAVVVGQSRADTIYVEALGVSPGISMTMYYDDDGPGGNSGKYYSDTNVGKYNWKPTSSSNRSPFDCNFQTFCIDVDQPDVEYGPFNIQTLETAPDTDGPGAANGKIMSGQQADWLRELWGENFASLCVGTSSEQKIKTAAFQLAIWEILFERSSTKSLANGYCKVAFSGATPAYVTLANQYLASTYDAGYSALETRLVALTNSKGQDQICIVPVPPAFAGGLSLMALMAFRKLRAGRR